MKDFILIESQSQFDSLSTLTQPYMVYFTTPTCSVCKSISPKLLKLVEGYPIDIYKVDVSDFPTISAQMLIFSIPTIILVAEQKEQLREVRFIQFENIERMCSMVCDA